MSLLLLDIDYFKRFNDTYGHEMGNELLRRLAALLKGMTRKEDVLARYGERSSSCSCRERTTLRRCASPNACAAGWPASSFPPPIPIASIHG